jgi:DNA-binding LytR/AlgR family response regulator
MRVVIIEDEQLTAEDLAETLIQLPDDIRVVRIIHSVAEAVHYFRQEQHPDLIFCDIQMGDGYSFDIFSAVKIEIPVIFCTAFDEYALDAFRNNGIDYILKPFSGETIKTAIEKYKTLRAKMGYAAVDYSAVLKNIHPGIETRKSSSLLINWKDKIIPIKISDIALFNIAYKTTQLVTFDNQKYFINHTLDELEEICGETFYRANRQYIINKESVVEALQYHARKLVLKLKVDDRHEIIISKNRVPEFLSWLRS